MYLAFIEVLLLCWSGVILKWIKYFLLRDRKIDYFISVLRLCCQEDRGISALGVLATVLSVHWVKGIEGTDVRRRAEGETRHQTYKGGYVADVVERLGPFEPGIRGSGGQVCHSYLCRSMCYLSCMTGPLYTFDLFNWKKLVKRQTRHLHLGNSKRTWKMSP